MAFLDSHAEFLSTAMENQVIVYLLYANVFFAGVIGLLYIPRLPRLGRYAVYMVLGLNGFILVPLFNFPVPLSFLIAIVGLFAPIIVEYERY